MPCNSDYMDPTLAESNSRKVAQLLVYTCEQLCINPSEGVKQAAGSPYGNKSKIDAYTETLCTICTNMSFEQESRIIYNARSAQSRRLADWWDLHVEADKARIAKEDEETALEKLREEGLALLTVSMKEALGL